MLNKESPKWLDLTAAVFGTLVTALLIVAFVAALSIGDEIFAAINVVLMLVGGVLTVALWRGSHGPWKSLGGRLTLVSLLVAVAGSLLPDPEGGITLTPDLTATQCGFFAVSAALALASVAYGIRAEEKKNNESRQAE